MKRNSTKNLFNKEAFCIHKAVLDQATEGFSLMDSTSQYVGVNQAFCNLTGYSESELLSMHIVDLLVPSTTLNLFPKLLEDGKAEHHIEILRKDGTILQVQLKGSPLSYDGQTYILAIVSDVSSQFESDGNSNINESKYRLLFDTAPDPIVIHDGKTILDINPATLKALSLSHKNEMIGQDPLSLVHPKDQDLARYRLKHLVQNGQPLEAEEFHLVLRDGKERTVLALPIPIEFDGQQAFMVNYHDITDRKRAEDERKRALREAFTANQVKNKFIANISHEIRTPLNSILGFSDILNQKYNKILNKGDEHVFDYINNASKRLIRTVDSILNISQLEAGAIKIYPQPIDLVSIAKYVIEELRQDAEEKALKIHLVSEFQEAIVLADEYCIIEAVTNLMENAIKFTMEGAIEIEINWYNDRLALSVIDSGIGISKDYQEQIYAPYTQESEGFTKNFQGIGLGMALTKRYADLNNVEIRLKSEAGVGTTFILIFSPYKGEANA